MNPASSFSPITFALWYSPTLPTRKPSLPTLPSQSTSENKTGQAKENIPGRNYPFPKRLAIPRREGGRSLGRQQNKQDRKRLTKLFRCRRGGGRGCRRPG